MKEEYVNKLRLSFVLVVGLLAGAMLLWVLGHYQPEIALADQVVTEPIIWEMNAYPGGGNHITTTGDAYLVAVLWPRESITLPVAISYEVPPPSLITYYVGGGNTSVGGWATTASQVFYAGVFSSTGPMETVVVLPPPSPGETRSYRVRVLSDALTETLEQVIRITNPDVPPPPPPPVVPVVVELNANSPEGYGEEITTTHKFDVIAVIYNRLGSSYTGTITATFVGAGEWRLAEGVSNVGEGMWYTSTADAVWVGTWSADGPIELVISSPSALTLGQSYTQTLRVEYDGSSEAVFDSVVVNGPAIAGRVYLPLMLRNW